jgi:hypothetical protein
MRKLFLPLTAALFIATTPQLSSAASGTTLAGLRDGASLVEHATYYRRDYDGYYPRYHRYYGSYPRYRHHRYYDYGYYPRRNYYYQPYYYHRPYPNYYYRRYWY